MARITRFEDIESWKRARSFANEIYRITGTGKFARDFSLRDQMASCYLSPFEHSGRIRTWGR